MGIELNDNNISQLLFKNLKTDKSQTFVMHGSIYQFESEFYINGIFKDVSNEYNVSLLPLKTLAAYPLGTIFKNKRITENNLYTNIRNVKITISKKTTGYNQIKDIPKLQNIFSRIPDKISIYAGQNKYVQSQLVAIYKDQISRKTLYIPHYEIARWFYLRSSSLTRQVLSSNLEGSYYEANYLDSSNKMAELYMKHGSSNGDAAEIFRFAQDEFSNIMFHNFSLDLSQNKYKNRTKIQANFPVYGELNLKIKGFSIDKESIFVYQFIEEDSAYPFEELYVYRYGTNNKKEKDAYITKKSPNKSDIKEVLSASTPSSEFENQTIENDVVFNELRKGLERKKIKFEALLEPSEDNDYLGEHKIKISGTDFELSVSDASGNGENNVIHTSIVQKQIEDSEDFIERENNLVVFKHIIFELVEIDKSRSTPRNISVIILDFQNLPNKPKDFKGRAKWKKSRLENGSPRQYIIAEVTTHSQKFYIIEIEQSGKDDYIATSIFYREHEEINASTRYNLLRNYVLHNGTWKLENSNIKRTRINHSGNYKEMAIRLYEKLI